MQTCLEHACRHITAAHSATALIVDFMILPLMRTTTQSPQFAQLLASVHAERQQAADKQLAENLA